MSINNHYADVTYTAEDLSLLNSSIEGALEKTETMPTTDENTLKHLAKIGLKSESFVREALAEAKLHTDLMPRGLNVTRMEANLANRDMLRIRLAQVEELCARLRAAVVLHGVDAYNDGLLVYNALKRNGDYRQAEAVNRLGRIFKRIHSEPSPQGGDASDVPTTQP